MTSFLSIDDDCEICGDRVQSLHLVTEKDRSALLSGYAKIDGIAVLKSGNTHYINCKNCVEKISNG